MTKVLFVCHGNICRSVMAQYMFEYEVQKRGLGDVYEADSVATSREEIGNPVYPTAARKLKEKGVPYGDHRARQITKADYENADVIFIMDEYNWRNVLKVLGGDPEHKIRFLLPDKDVADPWYTGDFERTYYDLERGIQMYLDGEERI